MPWMLALLLAAFPAKVETEPRDRGRQRVSATALAATGVSVGPGQPKTQLMRSPVMMLVDVGFFHPEHPWLEFSPALMIEFERGQLFGLGFRLRAFTALGPFRLYAIGGLDGFVAPRKLLGARIGGGVVLPLHQRFALTSELGPTVYFAGNDLPERTVITKLDIGVGIRVTF